MSAGSSSSCSIAVSRNRSQDDTGIASHVIPFNIFPSGHGHTSDDDSPEFISHVFPKRLKLHRNARGFKQSSIDDSEMSRG